MKLIPNAFVGEPKLIIEPEETLLDSEFRLSRYHKSNIYYIRALLHYGERWTEDSDLFQFIKPEYIEQLRTGKFIFVLDASLEGFGTFELPFTVALTKNCLRYGVDPRRVFVFTGNYHDARCYNSYLYANNMSAGAHIVYTPSVGSMVHPEMVIMDKQPTMEDQIGYCDRDHEDKFVLQLSRMNRTHRMYANYMLYNSPSRDYALISQDKIPEGIQLSNVPEADFNEWKKVLPLTTDHTDFTVNWANDLGQQLYSKTMFSVVLETHFNDRGGTSLFFSEKTFKPIVNRQPFIIFGQPGINHMLRALGFKTYEDWFDLGFDFEQDEYFKYKLILKQVDKLVEQMSKMTKQQRINWRFKNKELLEYNYQHFVHRSFLIKQMDNFHKTARSLFEGEYKNFITSFRGPGLY